MGELQTLSRAEIATTLRRHVLLEQLSDRDLEVLRRLARGQTQQAVARALGVCSRVVAAAVARIVEVLGAVNHTNAVAVAYEVGLLGPGDAGPSDRQAIVNAIFPSAYRAGREDAA